MIKTSRQIDVYTVWTHVTLLKRLNQKECVCVWQINGERTHKPLDRCTSGTSWRQRNSCSWGPWQQERFLSGRPAISSSSDSVQGQPLAPSEEPAPKIMLPFTPCSSKDERTVFSTWTNMGRVNKRALFISKTLENIKRPEQTVTSWGFKCRRPEISQTILPKQAVR